MSRYVARRLLFAVPTLLVISFIVFALLDLAPSDPTAQLPLTIPPRPGRPSGRAWASGSRSTSATSSGSTSSW